MQNNIVNFKYGLGDELEDTVTGFKGIVMVRAQYATGCMHYGLSSRGLKDGELLDWQWIDSSRLVLSKSGAVSFAPENDALSGPFEAGPES